MRPDHCYFLISVSLTMSYTVVCSRPFPFFNLTITFTSHFSFLFPSYFSYTSLVDLYVAFSLCPLPPTVNIYILQSTYIFLQAVFLHSYFPLTFSSFFLHKSLFSRLPQSSWRGMALPGTRGVDYKGLRVSFLPRLRFRAARPLERRVGCKHHPDSATGQS